MIPWTEPIVEEIFQDFSVSTDFAVSIEKLQEESYKMMELEESSNRSNVGGWQSPVWNDNYLEGKPITEIFPEFNRLKNLVYAFSTDVIHKLKVVDGQFYVDRSEWWVNKNSYQSYNNIHTHGRADLIGVFYVKSPKDSSCIKLVRNDGSMYTKLYRDDSSMGYSQQMMYPPVEGKFYLFPGHLWHCVLPQTVQGDRISSSYNLYLNT
tara:strand:- start:862 stop:1485 length:624 start_codon:yes stop_codon:yes gene_type:complete